VDITRQSLQLIFDKFYEKMITSYKAANITDFELNAKLILSLLDDLETLLASNRNFLVGKWIESARALAKSDEVMKNL
jgi:alpha-N-acetylglucosaminidase